MALCVLTGDIVGSTDLSAAELFEIAQTLTDANRNLHLVAGPPHFDIHRGDGWQAAFTNRSKALRIALLFRAVLFARNDKYETRIAIAVGDESLENKDISRANSPTFILSGRTLDTMSDDHLMAHASGGSHHAATVLADYISRSWTTAQARAIAPFLHPAESWTQKDVARNLGISRQAVGQALDAAGYPAIKAALTAIEEQAK
jgi:DNA-binding phage protein